MNWHQQLWWRQAQAELSVFRLLRANGVAACHCLHYLQMVTEKIAKAYLAGSEAPPRKHNVFVRFLTVISAINAKQNNRLAVNLGYHDAQAFKQAIKYLLPLAHQIESLSPSLAGDGPNTEYPWPHDAPLETPADHVFPVWTTLRDRDRGRRLLTLIETLVEHFPRYAQL